MQECKSTQIVTVRPEELVLWEDPNGYDREIYAKLLEFARLGLWTEKTTPVIITPIPEQFLPVVTDPRYLYPGETRYRFQEDTSQLRFVLYNGRKRAHIVKNHGEELGLDLAGIIALDDIDVPKHEVVHCGSGVFYIDQAIEHALYHFLNP